LAVQGVAAGGESSRNVAGTCRHFGISRQAFYKWKRRFDELGAAGLSDRPRTPHRSARATAREVVSKILYLRQHYHFGPGMIADYLKRFHQVSIAPSSVHRLLGKVQRQTAGVGGLLQLPSTSRGARWTDTLRTTTLEDESSSVNDLLRRYTITCAHWTFSSSLTLPFFEPISCGFS
jgi:transposase